MKFEAFVQSLQESGWKATLDAQHTGVRMLWEKMFPALAQMEEDTADLRGQLSVMKALLGEAANVIRSLTDEVESQAEADELRRLIDMISDARGRNQG